LTSNKSDGRRTEEEHARQALQFLVSDHGFTSHVGREEYRTVLAYSSPNIFFEMELDWRERAAFLLVGRSRDGGRPDGYYMDSQGRRVRWHLAQILANCAEPRLAGAAAEIRCVANVSGPEAMSTQIETFAEWLRKIAVDLDTFMDCIGE
jgi:hypothetical protein